MEQIRESAVVRFRRQEAVNTMAEFSYTFTAGYVAPSLLSSLFDNAIEAAALPTSETKGGR